MKLEGKNPADLLKVLCELYPLAFNLSDRKPLKVGIHKDIQQELPELSIRKLRFALAYYTSNPTYQNNITTMSHRIDLLGHEVQEITEKEKLYAAQKLE